MTENENTQAMQGQEGAQDGEQEAGIALQKIYVKDISFESPNAPEIFSKPWAPEYNMDLHTKNAKLADNIYEVVVAVTLTCTLEGMTAYIVEVQQAGIFAVQGLTGPQLAHVVNAYCPNTLFPYLREAIDTVVVKGSFPAAMLAPVNFDAIFAQAVMQKQQQAKAAAEAAATAGETPTAH